MAHNVLSVELPELSGPADFKRAQSCALKFPGCPEISGNQFGMGSVGKSPDCGQFVFSR
jgi:hypothetical protein